MDHVINDTIYGAKHRHVSALTQWIAAANRVSVCHRLQKKNGKIKLDTMQWITIKEKPPIVNLDN